MTREQLAAATFLMITVVWTAVLAVTHATQQSYLVPLAALLGCLVGAASQR